MPAVSKARWMRSMVRALPTPARARRTRRRPCRLRERKNRLLPDLARSDAATSQALALPVLIPYNTAKQAMEKSAMPRQAAQGNRIELRIKAEDKALLARAAALEHLDLTGFILRSVLPEARSVIDRAEHLALSERDSLKVLDLLEHPPKPTTRLKRAVKAGQSLP